MSEKKRMTLTEPMQLELKDGTIVEIKPGPYGKGVAVVPVIPRQALRGHNPYIESGVPRDGRGRPPRQSTVELRKMLKDDGEAGAIQPTSHYVEWMLSVDNDVAETTARSIVYRERRAALEAYPRAAVGQRRPRRPRAGGAAVGRKPSASTQLLRERLEQDAKAGELGEVQHYVDWLIKEDRHIGLKQARQLVYRERKRALEMEAQV